MSLFSHGGTSNVFQNQNNASIPQQNAGLFSLGQNNPIKSSASGTGIFGASAQNQNSNTGTALFQSNSGIASISQSNSNNMNQNNIKNPSLSTPMKNNNLTSGTSNLFGNNTQSNSSNIFANNTGTTNIASIFNKNTNSTGTASSMVPSTSTNIFQNINSTNQVGGNIFNSNPNNEQKSMFNTGIQSQTSTIPGNTAINQIFNQNPSNETQSFLGQTQSTNQLTSLTGNVTSNPTQNTSNFSLFNNNNTQLNQTSNQNVQQQNNSNQPSMFNQGNTTNSQNLFGTQPQQNNSGILSNNSQAGQTSLFSNPSSFLSNPTDNQNKEIKILPAQTLPKNDMFGSIGQSKPDNNTGNLFGQTNPTVSLFSSMNASGSLFESKPKTDGALTNSLFTSLNQATSSNKNLFGETQNPTNVTAENRTQFITAPSNILGINLDTLSENVKKACRSENKSIKDFMHEVEKDFQREDYRDYYRKIPNNISSSFGHGYKGMEEYHERQRHQGHKQNTYSRDHLSEFDFYKNFSSCNRSSGLSHQRENCSYLQTKILRSPEKENNYNFNRNVIELSLKVKNNRGSQAGNLYKFSYNDERLNNENLCENLINNDNNEASPFDFQAESEIPNGAINTDKMIGISIEFKFEEFPLIKIPLDINKNNLVSLLKESIIEKLKERKDQFFKCLNLDCVILMKQSTLMKDSKLISDYNLVNGSKITLILSRAINYDNDDLHSMGNKPRKGKFHLRSIKKNDVAPLESLPTLTMSGYKTSPDFKILCRMTLEELKNVHNFCIWNEYGKIEWKDSVDLTNLDLDKIVDIRHCQILVYQGKDSKLPPRGEGLNKPSIFTLNDIKPENEMKTEKDKIKFESLLKEHVHNQGGKFICYDYDNHKLVFECNEFKKEKN